MTAAQRKAVGERMTKYWAARRGWGSREGDLIRRRFPEASGLGRGEGRESRQRGRCQARPPQGVGRRAEADVAGAEEAVGGETSVAIGRGAHASEDHVRRSGRTPSPTEPRRTLGGSRRRARTFIQRRAMFVLRTVPPHVLIVKRRCASTNAALATSDSPRSLHPWRVARSYVRRECCTFVGSSRRGPRTPR